MIGRADKFRNNRLALGVASAIVFSLSCESFADTPVLDVDIQSQKAGTAFLELAETSGVQILLSKEIGREVQIAAISGEYTLAAALEKMLDGTGLSYQFTSDDLVVIRASGSETEEEGEDDAQDVDEEIVVTGSAIRSVNPTSKVDVYTADDIAKMGVSSVEDFLRKIPQNYSSLNTFISANDDPFDSDDRILLLGGNSDSINTSAANLYGLGADATLILINGRRTAESAKFSGGVYNVTNIPINAIERIEIVLDGASARYGSDAIGGVTNFITKKDYVGAETTARVERGLNGGDRFRFSQLVGYNWDSGGITATLNYEESKPVIPAKTGYVTKDQTGQGGSDWRSTVDYPQPAAVYTVRNFFGRVRPGTFLGALPDGHSGQDWELSDLSVNAALNRDALPQEDGVFTKNMSLTLFAEQEITEGVRLFSELIYSASDADSKGRVARISVVVPSSNAFNPTRDTAEPTDLYAIYLPANETESGLIPSGFRTSKTENIDLTLGGIAELPFNDWQVRVSLRHSENNSDSFGLSMYTWSPSVGGGDAFDNEIAAQQAAAGERFQELLASSDPNIALNLFGNGSAQSPFLNETFAPGQAAQPASVAQALEVNADGILFSLPGGDARLGLGFEYGREYRDYSKDQLRTGSFFGYERSDEPERERMASYLELDLPVVGPEQDIPLVRALRLNVSGRWEKFQVQDGTAVVGLEADEFGIGLRETIKEDVDEFSFDRISPRVGVQWQMTDTLMFRGSWGESFRAPSFIDLLGFTDDYAFSFFWCIDDLGHPDNVSGEPPRQACDYYELFGSNLNLQPEIATTVSYGFTWEPEFVDGLSISVTARTTDFENRIDSLFGNMEAAEMTRFPDAAIRLPNGDLDYLLLTSANFAERRSETVDINAIYSFDNRWGDFQAGLSAVYTGELYDRLLESDPKNTFDGTQNGPQQWRGKLWLNWSGDHYGASSYLNYVGSYWNDTEDFDHDLFEWVDVSHRVDPYWSLDLTGYYDFGNGWRVEGGATDITGHKPSFVDSPRGFSLSNWDPTGRRIFIEAKKSFSF